MRDMDRSRRERIGCQDFHRSLRAGTLNRRGLLRAGMLGAVGLTLSQLLRIEARAAEAGRPVQRRPSVIILWMRGGPSQHETWDPKPDAPSEYRGEFGAISTKVPGIQICDLLPMSARIMDKWSIIRSLHHTDAGHSTADQICFTGYPSGPEGPPEGPGNIFPSCGAVAAKQFQNRNPKVPAYVMIPKMVPGTGAGYLGNGYNPFETIADPARNGAFTIPNFALPAGISLQRLESRRALLGSFDNLKREV